MGATGSPTCVPLYIIERLEVDSRSSTQHLSRVSTSSIAVAAARSRNGDQEKIRQCYFAIVAFTRSSGSSAPTLLGRLGYKDQRAKCFFVRNGKKKKAVPFCRT